MFNQKCFLELYSITFNPFSLDNSNKIIVIFRPFMNLFQPQNAYWQLNCSFSGDRPLLPSCPYFDRKRLRDSFSCISTGFLPVVRILGQLNKVIIQKIRYFGCWNMFNTTTAIILCNQNRMTHYPILTRMNILEQLWIYTNGRDWYRSYLFVLSRNAPQIWDTWELSFKQYFPIYCKIKSLIHWPRLLTRKYFIFEWWSLDI